MLIVITVLLGLILVSIWRMDNAMREDREKAIRYLNHIEARLIEAAPKY